MLALALHPWGPRAMPTPALSWMLLLSLDAKSHTACSVLRRKTGLDTCVPTGAPQVTLMLLMAKGAVLHRSQVHIYTDCVPNHVCDPE